VPQLVPAGVGGGGGLCGAHQGQGRGHVRAVGDGLLALRGQVCACELQSGGCARLLPPGAARGAPLLPALLLFPPSHVQAAPKIFATLK